MAAKTSSDNTPNIKCQPKFESHIFSSDALNSLDIEDTQPIKSKCEHKSTLGTLLVAAIDFGTTFSGVAWQYRDGFKRYPLQIQTKCWGVSNRGGFPSIKIPTSLLLKPSKEFVAFGNEAEDEYAELADDNAHFGFYYFKNFKMLLYNAKKLCRTTMMSDEQGHEIHAKDVFMYCIRYLKEVVIEELEKSGGLVDEHEIHWVLTVPAIWNEAAKQFMREAAKEAGIPFNRITLALEPEAAAIYTKESLANRSRGPDGIHIQPYPPGTKYMVLDLGGGTVDVTVREVLEDRSLKELHKASGNDWGGRQVNIQFFRFLDEIFGKDVMNELRQRKSEFLDLERSVELKKRTQGKNGRITVDYPAILKDIYKEKRGKDLNNKIVFETQYAGKVDIKMGKILIEKSIVQEFFQPSIDKIIQHSKDILQLPSCQNISEIILVGGFAESKFVCDAIQESFKHLNVIVPNEASLAVLKGAVLFGQNPSAVKSRICNATYGTSVHRYFMEGYDDPEKKKIIKGTPYCKDVFNILAQVGQTFCVGETVKTEVQPIYPDMTKMSVHLYSSTSASPAYVTDEDCSYLGKMVVNMPDISGGLNRKVTVSLTFGDVQIMCEGVDNTTRESVVIDLDLLSSR